MRNVFLDGGDSYQGDADVAVNACFLNGADLVVMKMGKLICIKGLGLRLCSASIVGCN